MAISGGIKFLRKNRGDIDDENVTAAVSSGTGTRGYARNRKRYLRWESVGSDDVTTETYTYNFGAAYDIDRVILKRNNFKAFTVKYWNGAAWTHVANVVTKEGTQADITETANEKSTNYYEFDSVNTEKLQLTITTTQVVDAEKYLYEFIVSEELGTFEGYPTYAGNFPKNRAKKKAATGSVAQTILGESFNCALAFAFYPVLADHTLMNTLWDLNKEFLIYPCGANADQFRFPNFIGNRLEDIFLVAFSTDFSPAYENNIYVNALNYSLSMSEVP